MEESIRVMALVLLFAVWPVAWLCWLTRNKQEDSMPEKTLEDMYFPITGDGGVSPTGLVLGQALNEITPLHPVDASPDDRSPARQVEQARNDVLDTINRDFMEISKDIRRAKAELDSLQQTIDAAYDSAIVQIKSTFQDLQGHLRQMQQAENTLQSIRQSVLTIKGMNKP